jgi:hypothetical protein
LETPLDLIARPEDCALKVPIAETTRDRRLAASCRRDRSGRAAKRIKLPGWHPFPGLFLGWFLGRFLGLFELFLERPPLHGCCQCQGFAQCAERIIQRLIEASPCVVFAVSCRCRFCHGMLAFTHAVSGAPKILCAPAGKKSVQQRPSPPSTCRPRSARAKLRRRVSRQRRFTTGQSGGIRNRI